MQNFPHQFNNCKVKKDLEGLTSLEASLYINSHLALDNNFINSKKYEVLNACAQNTLSPGIKDAQDIKKDLSPVVSYTIGWHRPKS